MALTNYTNLQTTIADTLNRDDLTSVIPTFVSLCEAQVNRDLRHWRMETRSSGQQSAGDAYMQVPADWVETLRFNVVGNGTSPINLIDSTTMAERRAVNNDQYGTPSAYTLEAGQFHLYPTPIADVDLELLYYAQVPDLASNATNWLLSTAPDVYLYGSLLHSAPYLQDDNRVGVWAQLYSAAVTRLNEASTSAKYSGVSLKSKVRGLAP
jgi:hypothetical protein